MSSSIRHSLLKYWNSDHFRTPQEEIIGSVLNGSDTVALMPTGGGKSLCYQLPALHMQGICIVVSPLIALMKDQVDGLQKKGIKAIALTSFTTHEEVITTFDNLKFGNYKFLYLSPERLQSHLVQTKLREIEVGLIAVDEAHCISQWGHDFRPAYLNLKTLRHIQPRATVIALTGSATSKVLQDIVFSLELKNPQLFKTSFYRDNLRFKVISTENKLEYLERILKKCVGSSIVYTSSRRTSVELSEQLNSLGYTSCYYHGGMTTVEKNKNFENWMQGEKKVIVATNAFGMGIDKSNVKVVIHYQLPHSIENLIQEAGRAGRDGTTAYAILLKTDADIAVAQTQMKNNQLTVKDLKEVYFKLNQYFRIALGTLSTVVHDFSFSDFCKRYTFSSKKVHEVLLELEKEEVLVFDDNLRHKSSLQFLESSARVLHYLSSTTSKEQIVKNILRHYPGIFDLSVEIDEYSIARATQFTSQKVRKVLEELHADKIANYRGTTGLHRIQFLKPREDDKTINRISRTITERIKRKVVKRQKLIDYVQNDQQCRYQQLLSYFGETTTTSCGTCDVCTSRNSKEVSNKEVAERIMDHLKSGVLSSQELMTVLDASDDQVLFCLELLLDKDLISVTSQNKFRLNSTWKKPE